MAFAVPPGTGRPGRPWREGSSPARPREPAWLSAGCWHRFLLPAGPHQARVLITGRPLVLHGRGRWARRVEQGHLETDASRGSETEAKTTGTGFPPVSSKSPWSPAWDARTVPLAPSDSDPCDFVLGFNWGEPGARIPISVACPLPDDPWTLRQLATPACPAHAASVSGGARERNQAWEGGTARLCQRGAQPCRVPGQEARPCGPSQVSPGLQASQPGGRRILLLHLLCNSSSGPPPRLLRGKSMCSDSVISQVASLQVHRARKGDIFGHVWMGYTNTHTRVHIYTCMHPLSSLPSPAPAWHRIRWNFTTVACSCGGGSFVCVPGRQWRTPRSAALTSAPRSLWRGRCR